MEPPSKLAEIKLVSKYYPVANYSYPRGDDTNITYSTSRTLQDRTSVNSESSAPGLVEDRTDSEVSQDDDYQYHAHTTELWDSFWRPGGEWRLEEQQQQQKQKDATKNDHPTLVPTSPRHRRQTSQKSEGCASPSWPLPDSFPVEQRPRKPAAAYSAFPTRKTSIKAPKQPQYHPPPPPPPTIQSRHPHNPPQRPPRPDNNLLTPCIQQPASVPITFATPPDDPPPRNPARLSKPSSQLSEEATVRLTKSMDGRPADANPFGIHSAVARSSTDLTPRGLQSAAKNRNHSRTSRHYKSTTHLAAAREHYQKLQQQHELEQQRQAEPHSVFEEDSDSEDDNNNGKASFFRFHKRGGSSDSRTKMGEAIRKRRGRADTSPALPSPGLFKQNHHHQQQQQQQQQQLPERERKVDVFGKLLGRRSD